tara:strand:+ start:10619 stop:11041 length:423 start_codon:yes stop_codon:yes gene_type:complete
MSEGITKQTIEEILPVDEVVEYADDINMEKQIWKEKVLRCKMICLYKMDLPLTTNPKYLRNKQKEDLLKMIEDKMKDDEENILTEFNNLVCDELLHQDSSYHSYPTYIQPSSHKIISVEPRVTECCNDIINETAKLGLNL